MDEKSFAVIGGDLRSATLAELMLSEGKKVNIYGFRNAEFSKNFVESAGLELAVAGANIVIGPIPFTKDNKSVNATFHNEKVLINELFNYMKKDQILIAGVLNKEILHMAEYYDIKCVDILEREDMAVLNAIPTAEGAIQIAMEEMPITLHRSNAMVLGYGRIGKVLSRMLQGIGANVYVEARKYSDVAWIKSYGYTPVYITEIKQYIADMDIVFNTIPNLILDGDILNKVKKNTLIIDLASKPGGVDFDKAKELNIKTIWALSLPGKVAPVTAAGYIWDTVKNVISEMGC